MMGEDSKLPTMYTAATAAISRITVFTGLLVFNSSGCDRCGKAFISSTTTRIKINADQKPPA